MRKQGENIFSIYANNPPGLSNDNLVIYVPANSVDAYKAATNWSHALIVDRIQAIP